MQEARGRRGGGRWNHRGRGARGAGGGPRRPGRPPPGVRGAPGSKGASGALAHARSRGGPSPGWQPRLRADAPGGHAEAGPLPARRPAPHRRPGGQPRGRPRDLRAPPPPRWRRPPALQGSILRLRLDALVANLHPPLQQVGARGQGGRLRLHDAGGDRRKLRRPGAARQRERPDGRARGSRDHPLHSVVRRQRGHCAPPGGGGAGALLRGREARLRAGRPGAAPPQLRQGGPGQRDREGPVVAAGRHVLRRRLEAQRGGGQELLPDHARRGGDRPLEGGDDDDPRHRLPGDRVA
mmetsp:Transcript_59307/g.167020  ORF Transcript_59307/g.167020 Transcript_59307/m.167020 type:complete len:295 (+) Transcript_59307:131-1015(+)